MLAKEVDAAAGACMASGTGRGFVNNVAVTDAAEQEVVAMFAARVAYLQARSLERRQAFPKLAARDLQPRSLERRQAFPQAAWL